MENETGKNTIVSLTKKDVIALSNSSKREEFISKGWKDWAPWVSLPELKMDVRRVGLPDNSYLCVSTYGEHCYQGSSQDKSIYYRPRFYLMTPGHTYSPDNQPRYMLTNHLKDLRKKYQKEIREARQSKNGNQAGDQKGGI